MNGANLLRIWCLACGSAAAGYLAMMAVVTVLTAI
jgi:hypothetical protein